MGDQSAIEWTEATWNPIRGCSRVSDGCRNCYAERQAIRLVSFKDPSGTALGGARGGGAYAGLVKSTPSGPRWTGEVRFATDVLDAPLRWRRPRRIFVNSMSDLFHEKVKDDWIIRILDVVEASPQHTFQVLTKRPERMLDFFIGSSGAGASAPVLPNLWLGVSVEDQATADERIPLLLQTPAAVRWVSYEPALAAVDFGRWLFSPDGFVDGGEDVGPVHQDDGGVVLDWLVVGGESGPGARPFDLAWARQTIAQGRAAGVPVFVKQLGAHPVAYDGGTNPLPRVRLTDRKGGDPAEWPEDLRVRAYPHKETTP